MKKTLLLLALITLPFFNAQDTQEAQEIRDRSSVKFGVTGGLFSGFASAKGNGLSETNSSTGVYAGIFAEIAVTERFKIQPGLNYARLEDSNALQLPIIGKIYVVDNLNLQVGPQFLFDLSEVPADIKPYYNTTNIAIALGAGYDVTPKFSTEIRYSIQVNNHLKNAPAGYKLKANYLNVGIGYKFN